MNIYDRITQQYLARKARSQVMKYLILGGKHQEDFLAGLGWWIRRDPKNVDLVGNDGKRYTFLGMTIVFVEDDAFMFGN